MRRSAFRLIARRRLGAAPMCGEALFLFLIALVLEPLGFVFVHVPPPGNRRGGTPCRRTTRTWRATSDVVEDLARRAAEDAVLIRSREIERLDARDRTVDRTEEMRVVAAHHHVIGADELAREAQRRSAERHRVVVQALQVHARVLV